MIQPGNVLKVFCLCLSMVSYAGHADASELPAVESVLQNDFPAQPSALASITESLMQEYQRTGNVTSLVFYAYGMLQQAEYFLTVNDLINASEYAKNGFFYLDEAVERHENDARIRYLRARMDAYLPADLGRCVITLVDTELLLNAKLSRGITNHINKMRYRALNDCNEDEQARQFFAQVKALDPAAEMSTATNDSPSWDHDEVTNIIIPLVKGN